MIERILHPQEIEAATVQINSESSSSSAFFVRTTGAEKVLITCNHSLPENENINVTINESEISASIIERIPECDVALIKLNSEVTNISFIPIKSIDIPYNQSWQSYGFPKIRVNTGGSYNGIVSRIDNSKQNAWDIDLQCDQYKDLEDFEGLSGSPLVMDGYVTGVIGYDNVGTLGATSIKRITECLERNNVLFITVNEISIPQSLESDIAKSKPNVNVIDSINEVIQNGPKQNFYLLTGSPGSGKTTIAAQLNLQDDNYIILDRYFVKVPENEEYPRQIRATPDFFMRWIEEVCYRSLYNTIPPKPSNDDSPSNRIFNIHQAIKKLSDNFQQQGKTAFLIIDGLDDVGSDKMEEYLSVLPQPLPLNFKIIFSCVSSKTLPNSYQALINTNNEIKITPLPIDDTEKFLSEELKGKNLSTTQINELAEKSEGHPLYLRYLINYILQTDDLTEIDDWINKIPVISGEIENYYSRVWQDIDDQTDEVWLAATLARLRVSVDRQLLKEIVPDATRHHFLKSFQKIQHLLRNEESISIYHTSFSDYVNERTKDIEVKIHENIGNFILKNPHTHFGISERVYHLANAGDDSKIDAIEQCSQDWIDECAVNSINPDVVLSDVKKIVGIAADFGLTHKVISLLLLSQRLNFRYNTLFRENAIFLVNALLALGKPEEAIRYVVRNKTLTVSDGDGLYLLQKFFEYDAYDEGEILLNTIKRTCDNIIAKEFDTESFNRYLRLRFPATTLSSNLDTEEAFHEFGHIQKAAINLIEESGNSKELIHSFKDEVGSYNTGYFIWRFNMEPYSKKLEANGFNFNDKVSGFLALSIFHALEFQEKSPDRIEMENLPLWIEDLEYVTEKYGFHSDYHFYLLYTLVGRSNKLELIERIHTELFSSSYFLNIREENGVDLAPRNIHHFMIYQESLGFLDNDNKFPKLSAYGFYRDWEESLKSVFGYLCFLSGKVKRSLIEKKKDEIKSLEEKLNEVIYSLIPDLRNRVFWQRSYSLPEKLFPTIFKKFTNLLIDAFPHKIEEFVEKILQKKHYQLGLYTEGYIESLFVISRELARDGNHNVSSFKVAKILEKHILTTVENRWERNEYLLRLIELYAILENEDRAKSVFKEMINTSMGPTWYKEDQLGIINTAVSNIIPQNGDLSYLKNFAAHLDYASGEMTFQRYIKQQQEQFVGDLTKIGLLKQAVEYLQYLILPDYGTVINNAESFNVDMPEKGEGYVLGANAIEEQSAVLALIKNSNPENSLVVWALSELCILGADYHLTDYAKEHAKIINNFENSDPSKLETIFRRWSKFIVSEFNDEYRREYLLEFFDNINSSNHVLAEKYLEEVGMTNLELNVGGLDPDVHRKEKTDDPLNALVVAKKNAQQKLDTENKSEARKLITNALEEIQNKKYGVWAYNYSHKITDLRNLYTQSYNSSSELIKSLKNLILNEPYYDEWIIVDHIIKFLQNSNDENEKTLVLQAVDEHLSLMIKTPQQYYDKYNWITKLSQDDSDLREGKILLGLLIWFLNHPSLTVKNRVIEILTWLGTVIPKNVVEGLIEEILSNGYKVSRELSASIIHQLSNLNPIGFSQEFKLLIESNLNKLLQQEHFMIKNSLLDAMIEQQNLGISDFDNMIKLFEDSFVKGPANSGEIFFDETYLHPIDEFLYALNDLGILNKEFAKKLISNIENLLPLSIEDCQKASEYIDRSFNDHNNIPLVSDLETLLKYALNTALGSCTSLESRKEVANILRFYQPTFPENRLSADFRNYNESFENEIKHLFETGKLNFGKLKINGEIPLSYFSVINDEIKRNKQEIIDIVGYLVPLSDTNRRSSSYPWPSFFENEYPIDMPESENGQIVPLFIKCDNVVDVTGSDLVPAVLNKKVMDILPDLQNDINSKFWRVGRNWGNNNRGTSSNIGYFSTIPLNKIDSIKSEYKLVLRIFYGYNSYIVDIFDQKISNL